MGERAENGERDKPSTSGDANPLIDSVRMFAGGHSAFPGGLPSAYHMSNTYHNSLLGASGSRSAQYPVSTNSFGSLGTLSVAASQAASLGINPASAAWWSMASQLAAQDYLARLQVANAGLSFAGLPPDMAFPLLCAQQQQQHSQGSGKHSKSHSHTGPSTATSGSSGHHRDTLPSLNLPLSREGGSDPSGVLGGVRLPPDTEIIKYTSSIIGPKVPGTTNRGRKKTISLDPPSVSVTPTLQDFSRKNKTEGSGSSSGSHSQLSPALDPVSNGTPGYLTPTPPDCDAPLNLSLKPASSVPANNALQSLSSLSQSLGQMPDRISRRKPGPKPRRVSQSPLPPPGPAPSASLAQLFAAADSPRPPSDTDNDSPSHHKDGRPRNLGRGVSKPKKNTVASLLAQSRALGIKPSPALDLNSPLNHQVSILKANILQHQLQTAEGEQETEDKSGALSPGMSSEEKKLLQQNLEELRAAMPEAMSETSSIADVSSDSGSGSELESEEEPHGEKRQAQGEEGSRKKLKTDKVDEAKLTIPLKKGWSRETYVTRINATKGGRLEGEVTYKTPCGSKLTNMVEVLTYLENMKTDLTKENFSFNPKYLVGEFVQHDLRAKRPVRFSKSDIVEIQSSLKHIHKKLVDRGELKSDKASAAKKVAIEEAARSKELARPSDVVPNEEVNYCAVIDEVARGRTSQTPTESEMRGQMEKHFKELDKMMAQFNKDYYEEKGYFIEEEKREKQETQRKKERDQRQIQIIEARKKRKEEAGKLKAEEQQRKQQEREIKRQQTALLKEQIYMQELTKQRELLYTVELERERRRQHMALVKSIEMRKKQEEREKRRLEMKAEKIASREKRMEQRRIELDILSELRKPVEDMELPDLKPLPELSRILGLKLSGQAFADTLMVFDFLHTFGETLGFDMGSLPTLNSLQNALLGDEEAEEELLSVMTHLIICAIEDPGIPNPARHTTLLGQSLKQADITHANLSEILRIYLYANATGEVKALTGVQFEREREKKMSDHHNNMNESAGEESEMGKNAAFFVALRENPTWKMSESLKHKPFLALNASQKAKILQFLCDELLQNKAVIRQIDSAIETVAQLKRDRWTNDSKLRKLRHLHNRKVRQMAIGMMGGKEVVDDEPPPPPDEEGEGESGHESDGTQPEEEEDKKLSIEEMGRKLEKLNRQCEQTITSLSEFGGQLRAVCYGQDRYWRRYWSFPTAGGLFVEGMESAEPELFDKLLQEENDSLETPDIKSEYDAEVLQTKPLADDMADEDDEMPHLTPEVDTETLFSKFKKEESIEEDAAELPLIKEEDNKEAVKNDMKEEMDLDEKKECSDNEEDCDTKALSDDKKSKSFQFIKEEEKSSEECNGTVADQEPAWFSVLPREPCDTTSVTTTTSAFRCGLENSELRIPVFPPPPSSPSPPQCDSPSPAPLALTPEESAQLEHCKVYGLPRLAPPKPIPYDLRCGWWRITDTAVLTMLLENLHTRGTRERELRRTIARPFMDHGWANTLMMCCRLGSSATELHVSPSDPSPPVVPPRDGPDTWNYEVAIRVDMAVLEQVEAMEDKVANASMQVKGWKVPAKVSTDESRQFQPSCTHPPTDLNPIAVAKQRLMDLECAIERRYLKPPLGVNVSTVDGSLGAPEPDTLPKGLVVWREAVSKSQTAAQLSMCLHMLEASIAWDKSIMKAVSSSLTPSNCQFCHSGDNEELLLLCDGCDKGYHTYCFKPKMENIPDGDWYCYECMNKASGDKCCIVCGKKLGRNLVSCDNCPKAYHTDCLQPPLSKVPRGKWHCPPCLAKLPRKRLQAKRNATVTTSYASSPPPRADEPEPTLSPVVPPEELDPQSPPSIQPALKKEKSSGKKMAKEMAPCRQLLSELESHDEAWPFLLPVNTKRFPTYKTVIKNPMDFSTIKKRLMDSVYKSREEFVSDVRLIFNNCETFNEDDSPVGKAGHVMRLFFETRWIELTHQKSPS